jgi:hypothetical protein
MFTKSDYVEQMIFDAVAKASDTGFVARANA